MLPVSEGWFCLLELQKEHEREKNTDKTEREKLAQFSVGVSYHFAQGPTIGVAYGKGSEAENLDSSVQLKIQYEY